MQSNEIKPAIARQKVKLKSTGEIVDALCTWSDYACDFVTVLRKGFVEQWNIENCELIPDEPRTFKVGDKVARQWKEIYTEFTTVKSISTKVGAEDLIMLDNGARMYGIDELRHCTPEEKILYFS